MGQLIPKFVSYSGYNDTESYVQTSGCSGYKVLDKETLPPKCSYCGNWFKDIYKKCAHCGAAWEGK